MASGSNLKEGNDLFERTGRPPRVSVCGTRYDFAAASRLEGYNPGPIQVCPETAQVIADLSNINKKVAEQPTLQPQTAEIKTASLAGPAAYLGGPAAAAMIINKLGENFEQTDRPGSAACRRQRDADAPASLLARPAELPPLRIASRAARP